MNLIKLRIKGLFPYEKRKLILESIRYVDLVIPEEVMGTKIDDIKNIILILWLWAVIGPAAINSVSARICRSYLSPAYKGNLDNEN